MDWKFEEIGLGCAFVGSLLVIVDFQILRLSVRSFFTIYTDYEYVEDCHILSTWLHQGTDYDQWTVKQWTIKFFYRIQRFVVEILNQRILPGSCNLIVPEVLLVSLVLAFFENSFSPGWVNLEPLDMSACPITRDQNWQVMYYLIVFKIEIAEKGWFIEDQVAAVI